MSDRPSIAEQVRTKLLSDLSATVVEVVDLTDGACDGGAKLDLVAVAEAFVGVPLLKRHRMVNESLAELMPGIHALTMKTWTPEQYEAKK